MLVVAAVYLVGAVLLAGAGAAKAVTPEPAAAAWARIGRPLPAWSMRLLGVVELGVAVGAVVVGGVVPAIALAVLYAEFAVVAAAMVRAGAGEPCGCFGRIDMAATWRHVAANVGAAIAGVVAAAWPLEAADQLFDTRRWLLAPFAVGVLAGAYGVFWWLRRPTAARS
ncbi:MauE/DoxX family redox-associated membrane protein [Candidatus Poriferisocius sp.]|uniref:MauE/DoxX family redox-associated membrane protein n=1 Tax=Candidatus Poriferisocius sp. TaxID=3101276 RepID=UPI003B596BC1